jgi:hypothetical protein
MKRERKDYLPTYLVTNVYPFLPGLTTDACGLSRARTQYFKSGP